MILDPLDYKVTYGDNQYQTLIENKSTGSKTIKTWDYDDGYLIRAQSETISDKGTVTMDYSLGFLADYRPTLKSAVTNDIFIRNLRLLGLLP